MDTHLKEPLKCKFGLITCHNGIDIVQSTHGIKMHCLTYLKKILSSKNFDFTITKNKPLPMDSDSKYSQSLDYDIGPRDPLAHTALENSIGFKYWNAMGELIFAMITCRVDITFPVIKLTHFNSHPAACITF